MRCRRVGAGGPGDAPGWERQACVEVGPSATTCVNVYLNCLCPPSISPAPCAAPQEPRCRRRRLLPARAHAAGAAAAAAGRVLRLGGAGADARWGVRGWMVVAGVRGIGQAAASARTNVSLRARSPASWPMSPRPHGPTGAAPRTAAGCPTPGSGFAVAWTTCRPAPTPCTPLDTQPAHCPANPLPHDSAPSPPTPCAPGPPGTRIYISPDDNGIMRMGTVLMVGGGLACMVVGGG